MSAVPFAMAGAGGRMGRQIISLAGRLPDQPVRLVGALESPGSALLGQDAHILAGSGGSEVRISEDPTVAFAEARVIIDFTGPESTLRIADYCAEHGKALVIGTTGLTEAENASLREKSAKIPMLIAPNMSVGVNLLFHLVKKAAEVLSSGYDIEVVEAHHRHKKDAPSGTAVRLKDVLLEALERSESDVRHGRHGIVGARTDNEIGMHALRGGDVVGDHTVSFMTDGERVELTHRASSRDTFARGAISAAVFLDGKEPGLYTMDQVLGL